MKTNALPQLTYEELLAENIQLKSKVAKLEKSLSEALNQLEWIKRQIFKKTSEKFVNSDVTTLPLFSTPTKEVATSSDEAKQTESETQIVKPKRKPRGKTKDLGTNTDSGLRFSDGVEIVTEEILPDEVKDLPKESYYVVGKEVSDRIVSRESKRLVLRKVYLKVKLKSSVKEAENNSNSSPQESKSLTTTILKSPIPAQVLNGSYMSVSFLVDMILDKVLYSMPLYRQHQSLSREGLYISRSSLSKNFIKTCNLLDRIVEVQSYSILAGSKIAIDETPIKVGVDKEKHKMKKGYIWPIFGELNEIVYNYYDTRSESVLSELVGNKFKGTILSDGYAAYSSYTKALNEVDMFNVDIGSDVTHATCWIHARRKFVKLENLFPEVYTKAMEFIGSLYKIEKDISNSGNAERKHARETLSKPIVDAYFNWLRSYSGSEDIGKNKELRLAISYSVDRETSMREFIKDPSLSMDTNFLEREIRPIAIGRKNWMFCWTEVGAKSLCAAQSLIRTCLLHDINPRTYLIDVLQRLQVVNPNQEDVSDLIPRIWKEDYGKNPIPCPCESIIRNRQN